MSKGITFPTLDGSHVRVGIVTARWNHELTDALRQGVHLGLDACNVPKEHRREVGVAGSYEVLAGARHLIDTGSVDVVVCLGVLIKGETDHYEYIAEGVTNGIAALNTSQSIPVIFGILACQTEAQAIARSTGENNHGISWGKTAVEMALLRTS